MKPCPRCRQAQPDTAPQCTVCGFVFAAPPYGAPQMPGYPPPAQPYAQPQGVPAGPYPQPQGAPAQPYAYNTPPMPQSRPQSAPGYTPYPQPQGTPAQPYGNPQGAPGYPSSPYAAPQGAPPPAQPYPQPPRGIPAQPYAYNSPPAPQGRPQGAPGYPPSPYATPQGAPPPAQPYPQPPRGIPAQPYAYNSPPAPQGRPQGAPGYPSSAYAAPQGAPPPAQPSAQPPQGAPAQPYTYNSPPAPQGQPQGAPGYPSSAYAAPQGAPPPVQPYTDNNPPASYTYNAPPEEPPTRIETTESAAPETVSTAIPMPDDTGEETTSVEADTAETVTLEPEPPLLETEPFPKPEPLPEIESFSEPEPLPLPEAEPVLEPETLYPETDPSMSTPEPQLWARPVASQPPENTPTYTPPLEPSHAPYSDPPYAQASSEMHFAPTPLEVAAEPVPEAGPRLSVLGAVRRVSASPLLLISASFLLLTTGLCLFGFLQGDMYFYPSLAPYELMFFLQSAHVVKLPYLSVFPAFLPSVLMIGGLFWLYFSGRASRVPGRLQSTAPLRTLRVIVISLAALFFVCFIFLCGALIFAMSAMGPLLGGSGAGSILNSASLQSLSNLPFYTVLVIAFLLSFATVVLFYALGLIRTLSAAKTALETGTPQPKASIFVVIINFLLAAGTLATVVYQLVIGGVRLPADLPPLLAPVCFAGFLVFTALLILRYRANMKRLAYAAAHVGTTPLVDSAEAAQPYTPPFGAAPADAAPPNYTDYTHFNADQSEDPQ